VRIAFYVPHVEFLDPRIGGDNVLARGLLDGLRRRGHEVEVVSKVGPQEFAGGSVSPLELARETVSVRRRMKRFSPDAWFVYSPSEGRPDLFGWWQRPKHYLLFNAHAPRGHDRRDWRSSLLALAHRRALARADAVSAWRPAGIDRLRSFGIPEQRLHLLLPATETWQSMPSREEARRRLDLPPEAPVVLCVGRFSMSGHGRPRKTQMMLDLLGVVARLPSEVVLVIVGDGPGRPLLEQEAAKVEPSGRVRIMGPAERGEMSCFYAACDLYAYPSWKDYSWVSVLEAQYWGRPVITMHTRSAELSVQNGRTGLLAEDLDEFQVHLATLAGDRIRRESMGRAAREYVTREHTMDVRLRQIEDLLLGRSEHQRPFSAVGATSGPRARDLLSVDSS
jgi:glycosyltransferase involved in cell wall biosynthesis